MIISGFFPDVNGDRLYTNDFLAKWVHSFIGNGVYDGDFAVTAGENMTVVLPKGQAWINGYYCRNDGNIVLPIENADGVLNRKDIVVLRWDINTRDITAKVLTGKFASEPIAPQIIRTAEQYDLKIAEISIPAGTTAIKQSLITDTRLNNSVCGIVHTVVDHIKTETFYAQIQADLAEFKSKNEADFTAWLASIKDTLGEDAAGKLLNLINSHKADSSAHVTTLSCTKSGTVFKLTGLTATAGKVAIMFYSAWPYTEGDTVTIDGAAYILETTDGSTLTTGAWQGGIVVLGIADNDNRRLYMLPSVLKNPIALTVSAGYGSSGSTVYDGSAAKTVTVPYVTFHTSSPGTVQDGEIWAVYE